MRHLLIFSITILCMTAVWPVPNSESADDAKKKAEVKEEKPYGIEKRILVTTSTVVGSPEPPLPYRMKQTFTKLKLDHALYIEKEPGTDLLMVIQQDGKILRFANNPNLEETELFLDLGRQTYGLTFHPNYKTNGFIYVMSNGPKDAAKRKLPIKNRISRFTVDRKAPWKCSLESEEIVIEWTSNGHNGGGLVFGHDGYLYIPAGDGTSDSDTNNTGQDVTNLNATMIRIDVDHKENGKNYSIPRDNPFLDVEGALPEIWAFGFRNPWRICVDEKTGHIWVGNVGQDLWELVHVVKRGDNYGWAATEGGHPFHEQRKVGPAPIVKPTIEHPHSEARSITGGIVYYGKKFPELEGAYIYGDYETGKFWAARYDGEKVTYHQEIADTTLRVPGIGVGPGGEIYFVDYNKGIFELERIPEKEKVVNVKFPRKLSETGLFQSVKGHVVKPGVIPYDVNAPLWSDGSIKERFIVVPNEEKISFTRSRGWNFPNLSVLIKSFALEMEVGNPKSKKYVETRLLTRQQDEWVGYSYIWNDEQNDATLVEKKGIDRSYTIRDKAAEGGMRKQVWHFPSRADCMFCHSRAANYILGPSELQMNRDYDYGDVTDNQLRTMDHIGMFTSKLPAIDKLKKMVDPYDEMEPIDLRARSYIHANCAHCHVEAGGGNSKMNLRFSTTLEKMKAFDEEPQHHKFDLKDPRVIAPGSPERSTMFYRIARRGKNQMPPLATDLLDERAVKLFREWIAGLEPITEAEAK